MKYLVTYVSISRSTRRRVGKSKTIVFDTVVHVPSIAEKWFQAKHKTKYLDCKVVDIRPATQRKERDNGKAQSEEGSTTEHP